MNVLKNLPISASINLRTALSSVTSAYFHAINHLRTSDKDESDEKSATEIIRHDTDRFAAKSKHTFNCTDRCIIALAL